MIFYHGTSEKNWELIQKEGVLWGLGDNYRYTYLAPTKESALSMGSEKGVLLEVEYEPVGIDGTKTDNYVFQHQIPKDPPDMVCWQFSVFVPIPIKNVTIILPLEI